MGEPVAPDEDGWTEAYDAEVPRSDMVKKASNGTPWLLMKSAQNAAAGGLFGADAVAALVKAGEAQDEALIKSDYEALVKAKYSAEQMRALGAKGHAMRVGDGEYDYPIDDAEDLGRAIHAVGRGGADHDKIRAYVIRRAKALGQSDRIPDNWASDGSLKEPVAKAAGTTDDAATPGSPAWEAVDAAKAQQAITQLQSLRSLVQQLAQREGAEFAAGDGDDFGDVLDLQCVDDALRCALKTLAGFCAVELDAAGDAAMAKAAAAAKTPDAVHDTITKLAGACGCPVCAGFIAGVKQQGAQQEASQPPADANDGPADTQQAPQPAAPKPMPAAPQAAVSTPEQTMTKAATDTATQTAAGAETEAAAALLKAQKKADKKAKRTAEKAALAKAAEENTALKGQLEALAKRVEDLAAQPATGSGPMFNGAQPGANPLAAAIGAQLGQQPGAGAVAADPTLLKSIADETDPVLKAGLQQRASVGLLKQILANGPVMNPSSEDPAAVA
jgi:hypothetical protein